MDDRTVSFDELVDLEWPINLRRVDKKPFLFYLAGKVPLSVTDLVSECSQNKVQIRKILNRRFQGEIQIDQTGFLTLTDTARSPVVSYGKQFISQAKNESNQAAELREDEQIEAAGARYFRAAKLLAGVRKRFAAVNYVPDQLDASIERLEEKADNMRKEHAKDVYKHRNLLSNQREEEGDEALQNDEYDVAETKFRKARDALQEALDEISTYNDTRLSAESPQLRTDSLKDRLEALQRKYAYAGERQTTESTDATQSDSATEDDAADGTPAIDSDPDVPSKQALLDAVEDLAQQLRKAPATTEMKEQGRFEPHQYYDAFGTWREALERTALTVRPDLISDLRRVADELDKRPTQTDLDEHGRYDGHRYKQYFDTWEDALEAADIEEPTPEELIAEIQRLDREHARIPSTNLMGDEGKYSPPLIRDHFGSWDDALEAAGIDKRQRLIDELKRVDAECDERPTTTIASDISIYSPTYFSNEFGSWSDALEAAGITDESDSEAKPEATGDGSSTDGNKPTDEELLEEIRLLEQQLGHVPSPNTIRFRSTYSIDDYRTRFGSWNEALEAAGLANDPDSTESDPADGDSHGDDTPPTDEELFEEIHRLDRQYERIPLTTRMREEGQYSPQQYYNRFGSWNDALEAAGINKRERLIAELKRLGNRYDGRLTSTFFEDHSEYDSGYIVNAFGSWDEALAAAGLITDPQDTETSNSSTTNKSGDADVPTDEELLHEVKRLAKTHDQTPTAALMQTEGEYNPDRYSDRFGSWDETLQAAGMTTDSGPTKIDLIADLQRLNKEIDGELTTNSVKFHGKYAPRDYQSQFESWEAALEAAGIRDQIASEENAAVTTDDPDSTSDDSSSDTGRPSDEELIEEVRRLNRKMTGTPTGNTMMNDGKYNTSLYYMRFGSWDDALEEAGITADSESGGQSQQSGADASDDVRTTDTSSKSSTEPTDEELLEALRGLDRNMVGTPTGNSMMNRGAYSPAVYLQRFGSWGEALEAAGITPPAASDRSSAKREPATSKDLNQGTIHPNKLAELYESLRVLNKVLIEYIDATPNLHLGADEPMANWQSAIEDVAVGDGISDDVPCLGQLQADRNPFSMNEYREQYGNGDRITEFEALAVAEIGAKEYSQLVKTSDSTPPKPRLPMVPGNGKPLPTLLSSETQLSQALELLEELLTTTLDIDTVEPHALTASQPDSEPTTISTSSTPAGTDSDTDPLTLTDVEPNETHDGPLVGRLTGYIANPSGEATSQLHCKDIAGNDFWLYITDQDVDHECEKGNWYFISQFRGPEELGGGRGDQALRSTSQLLVENHGTSLPPTIEADVSEPASSRTQSPSSTQTSTTTASSDGQTATSSSSSQTATSSTNSSSGNDRSDSGPDEEMDPMVDDLLGDMEDEGLL